MANNDGDDVNRAGLIDAIENVTGFEAKCKRVVVMRGVVGVGARDRRRATVRMDVLQSAAARGRIGRSKRSCSLSGGGQPYAMGVFRSPSQVRPQEV